MPSDFHLTAPSATVRVDHADTAVYWPTTHYQDTSSDVKGHQDLRLDGFRTDAAAVLYVHADPNAPAPSIRFQSDCLGVKATPEDVRSDARQGNVYNKKIREVDVRDSLQILPCGDMGRVVIEGDFLLSLWDWDAHWKSDQGEGVLDTGYHDGTPTGTADEAFLTLHDATLVLPVNPDNLLLFVPHVSLTATELLLRAPEGSVPSGDARMEGDRMVLTDARADLYRAGQGQVRVQLTDSAAAPLASTAPAVPGSSPTLLALLAAALLASVVVVHQRRTPERALALLWSDHELDLRLAPRTRSERRALGMQLLGAHHALEGRRRRGQRLQSHAVRHYPEPIEALMGLGEALLALGAYEHALDAFFVVQESDPTPTQHVRAQLGAAAAHLRRGDRLDRHVCAEYVRDAQARDPGTVRRLLENAGELGDELIQATRASTRDDVAMFG